MKRMNKYYRRFVGIICCLCLGLTACNRNTDAEEDVAEAASSHQYIKASDYTEEVGLPTMDTVEDPEVYRMQVNEQARQLEVEIDRKQDSDVGGGWRPPQTYAYVSDPQTTSHIADIGFRFLQELYDNTDIAFSPWAQFVMAQKMPSLMVSDFFATFSGEDRVGLYKKFQTHHELDQQYWIFGNNEDLYGQYMSNTNGLNYMAKIVDAESFSQSDVNERLQPDYMRLMMVNEFRGNFVWYTGNAFECSWPVEGTYYVTHNFRNADGTEVASDFAHYAEVLPFVDTEAYRAVSKNFNYGHYKFVAIQPKTDISAFIAGMNGDMYAELMNSMQNQSVNLFVPNFKIQNEIDMKPVWSSLVNPALFEPTREWSIALRADSETKQRDELCIDAFWQKTYFSMNGRGARSYETITDIRSEDKIERGDGSDVWLDQPFVWVIADKETNIPVMMGILTTTESQRLLNTGE